MNDPPSTPPPAPAQTPQRPIGRTMSMDDAVEVIGFGPFHWWLTFLCGVGYFAEITELVIVSFVAPSIARAWSLSSFQYGLLGSSSFVGMAVGAFFWGWVGDRFGRQLAFSTTVWMTFFGGFLSAFSPNYAILLLLRFTAAFGIGGMLPVDYTVFLEFLPSQERGSKIVLVDAIGVIPALTLSALSAFYFSGSSEVQWRFVLAVAAIPVGIMGLLRRHVPESPRYHLAAGETDLAQQVIQDVADTNSVDLPKDWVLEPCNPLPECICATGETYQSVPSESELTPVSPSRETSATSSANGQQVSPLVSERSIASATRSMAGDHSHSFGKLLQEDLRPITWRLWLLYFLVQFSSSGMVFALPTLFDQTFENRTEREIALDLLVGVVGLVPGLAIAYKTVDISRTKSLAGFFLASGMSVLTLGAMFTTKNQIGSLLLSIVLRGAMEGCFAILNTTAVEAYPTVLRASGLGTAQIFDHVAGSFSPVIFSMLNGYPPTRPYVFWLYGIAYLLAILPAMTLPDYAGQAVNDY